MTEYLFSHFFYALMSKRLFLQELYCNYWGVSFSAIEALKAAAAINAMDTDPEPIRINGISEQGNISASYTPGEDSDVYGHFPDGSIAVLPLAGILTKYGTWWNWGADQIADLIRLASASSKISGIILLVNTPGGNVDSVFQITDAIKSATIPVYALVDGGCYSAGEYIRGFCTKSFAVHQMCGFGSVGVVATFKDYSEMEKEMGIKTILIYPPESKFKNLPERQALDGKPDLMIKEQLTPWATNFQDTMKANLPKMNTSIPGILEGKEFFAVDALEYGWIDGITNLDGVITEITKEIETRKSII